MPAADRDHVERLERRLARSARMISGDMAEHLRLELVTRRRSASACSASRRRRHADHQRAEGLARDLVDRAGEDVDVDRRRRASAARSRARSRSGPREGRCAARSGRRGPARGSSFVRRALGRQLAPGHRGDEARASSRWRGRGEDVEQLALLDDAAGLDHRDAVADRLDHRHLMGDQQDGQAELAVDVARAARGSSASSPDRAPRSPRRRAAPSGSVASARAMPTRCFCAAGELGRIAVALVGEADELEQLADAGLDRALLDARRSPAAARRCRRRCATTAG